MAEKRKKSDKPGKKAGPKGDLKDAGEHPEQKRAEQEEERTLQDRGAEEPMVPESGAEETPSRGAEAKQPAETEGPSVEVMQAGRLPVVGIGASAGGLEALEAFFDAVPVESGIAYVVITHTDPKRESMLPDLIRRKAKIDVRIIEDGMRPEPDVVYLPRSSLDPIMEQGVFRLKMRPDESKIHMPVDLFLRSLAENLGELAGCIILSGTGTDGSQGMRLIKEKGGVAMAQDPESARHPGMPKSAVEEGLVDYVLPPGDMPERLIRYYRYPAALQISKRQEPDSLRRILTFLAKKTHHDFFMYKENTLVRRIERRMTVTHSRKASDYLKLLNSDPEEAHTLFQDLLIGVTSFFRDPDAFDFLKTQVLPDLLSRENSEPLRVWIPGCATGEEAYSVAIMAQELLDEKEISAEILIFGTDIDGRAIEKARHGTYVENIVSDVSTERLKRFFVKENSNYRVKSGIRDQVVFAEQNILSDPPFSRLDLLVCRNLLIYLKPEAQNRLIPIFHYALRNTGALFLGSSEGVGRFQDLFDAVSKQHSIYRKRNHGIRPEVQFPMAKRLERRDGKLESEAAAKEQTEQSIVQAVEKELMEKHTPPCVVVNPRGEILYIQGRTGKYLEPAQGQPTMVIGDMAREGLRFPLLSALRRLDDQGTGEIREKGVRVRTNHEYQRIDLVVKSLPGKPPGNYRMVIFEELPEPPETQPQNADPEVGEGQKVIELEQDLMRVREDYKGAMEELQTSNEELRSSNEELHSSNEELQSTNEELESSREELQSVNEELNTVNSELNGRIIEAKEAYSSISRVLDGTRVAIVFLDNRLRITRFTPEASELLNLIDSDVGRPLKHITHRLKNVDLVEKARHVLKNLSRVVEEVRTVNGAWYKMSIMIHRPVDGVIEGVVLTFINIDEQKEAQKKLEEMKDREISSVRGFAESIVNTVREFLLVLDNRMRVLTANSSFYHAFRTRPEETEGKRIFELGNGQWDIPALRKLLQDLIAGESSFQDFLVEHRFPEIGFKRMMLNARLLQQEEKEETRILLAMEDVTEKTGPQGET